MANIASLLKAQLATPERILYRHFVEGGWRDVSVREIAAYAARWQAFLRAEGLAQGDRVALCLKNGIHWVAADQGALGLGLVVVPLYVDDNPENVAWCLENSGARLLVVENDRMADALSKVSDARPRILSLAADSGGGHGAVEAALPHGDVRGAARVRKIRRARQRGAREVSREEAAVRARGGGRGTRRAPRSGPRGPARSGPATRARGCTGAREDGRQNEVRGARRCPARSRNRVAVPGARAPGSPGVRNDRGLSGDLGESAGGQRSRIGRHAPRQRRSANRPGRGAARKRPERHQRLLEQSRGERENARARRVAAYRRSRGNHGPQDLHTRAPQRRAGALERREASAPGR